LSTLFFGDCKIIESASRFPEQALTAFESMLSNSHWRQVRDRGFSDEQIRFFAGEEGGAPILQSLEAGEIQRDWLDKFPCMKDNEHGALLLRFNSTTYSLRPDELRVDGEKTKYLYAIRSDDQPKSSNTQPWVPDGDPIIATEGLFDALVATFLMGTPCVGATAPSHLKRSKLPSSVKVYVNDADVPFHHSEGFLAMVVGHCCEQGLAIANLPCNPSANYRYTTSKIPDACKWGMEEWAAEWRRQGLDPKSQLANVIATAKTPVEYLKALFRDYKLLGIRYPDNDIILANAARAIVDATNRSHEREVLCNLLKECTGAKLAWIKEILKQRHKNKEASLLRQNQCADVEAYSFSVVEKPNKAELQEFLGSQYKIRFNELSGLVELNDNPMQEIDLADQFLAQAHKIEVPDKVARSAFEYLAKCNSYNPCAEYFRSLRERKDLQLISGVLLAKAFGISEEDRLSHELLARHLVGHVKRGINPSGIDGRHHAMLILVGRQGQMKSSAIQALAPNGWYDSATEVSKLEDWNFLPKLNSVLLFEFDECEKMIRSKTSSEFKGFITRASDKYVEKFKSVKKDHPRRSCLWGTTNERELLSDPTGSRRFWIVDLLSNECDPEWIKENCDSIWASVMTWMDWDLDNWISENSVTAQLAARRAHQYSLSDPLENKLRIALESLPEYLKHGVSQETLIEKHLGRDLKDCDQIRKLQMRITRVITSSQFTTHDGLVRWQSSKARFPDVARVGPPSSIRPLAGYLPVPTSEVPLIDSDNVKTPLMPWEDRDLKVLFQRSDITPTPR
jgi:predicted P-loop ATPase